MSSLNPEVLLLKSTGLTERFNAALQHLSRNALHQLFLTKIGSVAEIGKNWREASIALATFCVDQFALTREKGGVLINMALIKSLLQLDAVHSGAQLDQASAKHYLSLLPGFKKTGTVTDAGMGFHEYAQGYLVSILDELVEDMKLNHTDPAMFRTAKIGDVLLEGNGFEVKTSKQLSSYVEYTEGNIAVMVIHDVRENQFLLVERYNPIDGVFTLEFPRASGHGEITPESHASTALRDLTGLSLRDLEKIGEVRPDAHLVKGSCDVFYGNFDLEENHQPLVPSVRSLKRITEDGLYQAAYEKRITCALTLSAISVWHAFESIRKKRVANSKRVRTPVKAAEEEVEADADEE
ncbi:hypothetical protein IFT48_00180 [Pseudomonas fluorescens]|uniref:hypothetical protein n=1 Tax=Pseudomonas TaxID=286 RepID=UPI000F03766D|nr:MULTISPECIES: hypothetical protein [Pseudomonas]MBD8088409.1 hypothetical protein [Pseudomonas fluorescens]MBD8615145.1 hypothetical protein [Pseudomonas putida]MBD8681180.1 hypothetical protein [Pseudomonas sp. CFBP 13719]